MRGDQGSIVATLWRIAAAASRIIAPIALAVLATFAQILVQRKLAYRSEFSFLYLAVLLSSLWWGRLGGAITLVAAAVLAAVFVLGGSRAIPWDDPVERTELLLFSAVAISIIVLVDRLRRAREDLAIQRDTLEGAVRDRTRQLEETHERLRVSERMAAVGELAAGLAHDLGNLIMPMQIRLRRLEAYHAAAAASGGTGRPEGDAPDPRQPHSSERAGRSAIDDVHVIAQSVDYLASLARGLRLFARDPDRADSGEVTHTVPWVRDTTPFFQNVLPRHIQLKVDVPDDLPDLALPPHRLTQAVINLIGNARDAIGSNPGQVAVRASVQPAGPEPPAAEMPHPAASTTHIRIEVVDNGPGMTEEIRQRCLEPYFTTRAGAGGTGLGLALVHDVVRSAGGRLEVDSAPGRGARFIMTLPAAQEGHTPPNPAAA